MRRTSCHSVLLVAALVLAGAGRLLAQNPPGAQAAQGPPLATPEELACAPALGWQPPTHPVTIIGSQEGPAKDLLGPGDGIVIAGGRNRGLEVGQQYFVRRLQRPFSRLVARGPAPLVRRTAGWVRLVAVEETMAVATVVHACDGMLRGDYLEPFELPTVPAVGEEGQPDYDSAATVLFGPEGSATVGTGQFVVLSRGSRNGVHPGQRVTLFRRSFGSRGPVTDLGVAVVTSVTPDSSVARVLRLRDALLAGDLAAPQR